MSRKGKQTEEDPTCLKKLGNHQYVSQLSSGLNQLRKESCFCDVTIIVGEQRFPAHKAVLSCASSYFQGMFSAGFQESSMSEVTVPGTEECFAQLLEFAYTGYFSLSLRTAVGILRMACYMVQQDAMQLCAEYLQDAKSKLSMGDCFKVWSIAENHDILKDLTKSFEDHLIGNFPECGRSDMFLENASAVILFQMLMIEGIETDTCGEEQIVEVVLAWLKHDWEHRHTHAADLLKKLRLGLLPLDKLEKLLGEEVLGIPECKAIVEEVRRLDATKEEADVPLIQSHPDMFASRNTIVGELYRINSEFLLQSIPGCYKLDLLNSHPSKYSYLEVCRSGFTVVDDTELYVAASGFALRTEYKYDSPANVKLLHRAWVKDNNFCKFDLRTNKWTLLTPMDPVAENRVTLHQMGDILYAVGENQNDLSYFIHRYSLITDRWIDHVKVEIPGKAISIFEHAVVEGRILFAGTSHRHGDEYLLYDPASNTVCEVQNNSDIVDEALTLEVANDGTCYFRVASIFGGLDRFYKAICDFSGDMPSITLEFQEGMHASQTRDRKHSQRDYLTFDPKKSKMTEIRCTCHRYKWCDQAE